MYQLHTICELCLSIALVLFSLNILYLLPHSIVNGMKFWIHGMYYVICACLCVCARVCARTSTCRWSCLCIHNHLRTIPSMLPQNITNSISVASSVTNSLQIPVFDCILNSSIKISFPFQMSLEVHQPTKSWIQRVQTINNNDTTNYKYCRIYLFLFFTNSIKISSTKMLWTNFKKSKLQHNPCSLFAALTQKQHKMQNTHKLHKNKVPHHTFCLK